MQAYIQPLASTCWDVSQTHSRRSAHTAPQRPHRAADTPGPRSDAPSSAAPPGIHTKTRHTTARRPVPDQHHIIRKHPAHVHDQTAAQRLPAHTPSSHAPRNGQPHPRWKPCSTRTTHEQEHTPAGNQTPPRRYSSPAVTSPPPGVRRSTPHPDLHHIHQHGHHHPTQHKSPPGYHTGQAFCFG